MAEEGSESRCLIHKRLSVYGKRRFIKAPYLSPYAGYYHKSGLFLSTSLSYLTGEGQGRIVLYKLSGGYDYYGEKFEAGMIVSEYFFNDYSYTVVSEMSTSLSAYVGYDLAGFIVYADRCSRLERLYRCVRRYRNQTEVLCIKKEILTGRRFDYYADRNQLQADQITGVQGTGDL